jgi:hypothetical protein
VIRRSALLLLGVASLAAVVAGAADEHPLFNGKDLDGWDGDARLWSVQDGVIVGTTEAGQLTHNEFLISKQEYGDFDLHAEMKLRNHNSGIQFRSEALPEYVVKGYQADAGENNYWGNLYEEKGTRGTMVDGWASGGKDIVDLKGWNTYDIHCQGDHIVIKLNGKTTVDIHDSAKLRGVIALQLHAGPGMQVSFRNIRIREL